MVKGKLGLSISNKFYYLKTTFVMSKKPSREPIEYSESAWAIALFLSKMYIVVQ